MAFVHEAGVSPVYLGIPWSLVIGCFPELKQIKEVNSRGLRRLAELQKKSEEASEKHRQEQQVLDNDPKHILTRSYYDYIVVKKCFELRQGYASVSISEKEMDRARTAAKGIEAEILKSNPSVDKDAAWKTANSDDGNWKTEADKIELLLLTQYNNKVKFDQSDRNRCQNILGALEARHQKLAPAAAAVKKDF